MPREYRVELTAEAQADLERIYEFIAGDSPQTAAAWLEGIERRILTLERFPFRCPVIREAAELGRKYRHLIYGNYRAICRVEGHRVLVIRVIHGAQLLDTSILER